MDYRPLGRTGMSVSAISFGAWAIGGSWGAVDDEASMRALHAAIDAGVNFIDTADVYGDGRSERLVARLRRERPGETIYVATKAGRRLPVQTPDGYTRENLVAWVDRSLRNLEVDAIDLLQLHCPPTPVFGDPAVFGVLDDLVAAGKMRHYGVSVERVDEALDAIRYPGVEERADHLQHVPPEAGGRVLPRGEGAQRRHPRARAARQRTADRQAVAASDVRRRTITAASTATARRSTRARRSPACPTTWASRPSRSCAPLVPRRRDAARSSRCAGC